MADMSHTPSTAAQLQAQVRAAIAQLESDWLWDADENLPSLKSWVDDRSYGALASLAWLSPKGFYCRCGSPTTCHNSPHGRYAMRSIDFRIKCDFSLNVFLNSIRMEMDWFNGFKDGR